MNWTSSLGAELGSAGFWISVLEIMWINILLSGDNAVMIALACRSLMPTERLWGVVIGAVLASILRIVFTGVVSVMMTLPYLKLIGGGLLVWIAIKLIISETPTTNGQPEVAQDLWRAMRIVVIADVVMSLDNVIAIAAVAKGQFVLLAIGLAGSIPMVIAGSAVFLALLVRFPPLVWGGAAILGWVAGDIFASDPIVLQVFSSFSPAQVDVAAHIVGAMLVVVAGYFWRG
jgi:YjbE family integral membrane protein